MLRICYALVPTMFLEPGEAGLQPGFTSCVEVGIARARVGSTAMRCAQKDIAEAADVTEVIIRNRYSDLKIALNLDRFKPRREEKTSP